MDTGASQVATTQSPPAYASLRVRLAAVAGVGAFTGYVAAVDPSDGGVYPLCPSQAIFGLDCPACGGLRGTHALLNGRFGEALDYNLLLPLLLGTLAVGFILWVLPFRGPAGRAPSPPGWLMVVAGVVLGVFTVLRNLPIAGLESLASS